MGFSVVNSKFSLEDFQRRELNGQEHIVVPVTMIVPGVLNGSGGAGYYPAEENKRSVRSWNHMPIVAPDHPKHNGQYVSARSPSILDKYSVGVVLNSRDDDSLKADAWINVNRAQKVDQRILWSIYNKTPIEVSTGLDLDRVTESGVYNGKSYDWVAKSYRPDHLAILLNTVGACSIKDGCGLMVNELSVGQRKSVLQEKLRAAGKQDAWIIEDALYDDEVVYDYNGVLYRVSFLEKDNDLVLVGDHSEVKQVVSFISVNAGSQQSDSHDKGKDMEKEKLVSSIVNSGCDCWTSEDAETLNSFSVEKLTKIHNGILSSENDKKIVKVLEKGMDDGVINLSLNEDKTGVIWKRSSKIENSDPNPKPEAKTQTLKMEDLPEEVRNAVAYGQKRLQEDRQTIINQMLEGKTDDQKTVLNRLVKGKSIEELQDMLVLNPPKAPTNNSHQDYSGRRVSAANSNSGPEYGEDAVLVAPSFSFSGDN